MKMSSNRQFRIIGVMIFVEAAIGACAAKAHFGQKSQFLGAIGTKAHLG